MDPRFDSTSAPARDEAGAGPLRALDLLRRMRERHGEPFPVRLGRGERLWVVGEPRLVERVFQTSPDVLHAGEGNRRALGWLGEHSLILLDGGRHMRHRRLLLPAFHRRRLDAHAESVRRLATATLDSWPSEREVPALPRMRALAREVIVGTAFGLGEAEGPARLRESIRRLLPPEPQGRSEREPAPALVEEVGAGIEEEVHRRSRDSSGQGGGDFLSLLLESRYRDGSEPSVDELRDELLTLVVAGAETTAGSLAWALERLARAPDPLRRVAAEAPVGGGPHTEAAILETLRMRPVVPFSARMVKQPFGLGGCELSPGEVVAASALLAHFDPEAYPDPGAFRPERFLDAAPGTYTWIPFGGGVRRCIGAGFALLEMRIVLSTLLARRSLSVVDSTPEHAESRANTMHPAGGARVVLAPLE